MNKKCVRCIPFVSAYPASDRCKHVGHPQNPSPPSTTIFFADPSDMCSPPPAPAAAIALASASRLWLEAVPGRGALDPPEAEIAAAGLPAKEEEEAGMKPSTVAQRVSAQSAARSVFAMASLVAAVNKTKTFPFCLLRRRRASIPGTL